MGNSGLSKFLIRDGLLSAQDCQIIVRECGHSSSAFAKGVIALGLFTENGLAKYLSERTQLPIVPRERLASASSKVIGCVDTPLLERLEVLPVELKGNTLVVAMADPLDEAVMQQLNFFLTYDIQPVITTTTAIHSTLKGVVSSFSPERSSFQSLLDRHLHKDPAPSTIKRAKHAPEREHYRQESESSRVSSPDDLVDDIEDSAMPNNAETMDDGDLGLELSSSINLDDFSVSGDDPDIDMDGDGIAGADLDSDDFSTDSQGAATVPGMEDLEELNPFDDPDLDDPDAPSRPKTPSKTPGPIAGASKPAPVDPMALWGDESMLADAESELDDVELGDKKAAPVDPMALWGDESVLADAESELDGPEFDPEETGLTSDKTLGSVKAASAQGDDLDDDGEDLFGTSEEAAPAQGDDLDDGGEDLFAASEDIFGASEEAASARGDDLDDDGEDLFGASEEAAPAQGDDLDDDREDLFGASENDSATPEKMGKTFQSQDAHDYGIGHLNHALAQLALSTSQDEAKTIVMDGLQRANISSGLIFVCTEKGASPLANWSREEGEQATSLPEKQAITPALAKFAAITKQPPLWETLATPPIKLKGFDELLSTVLSIKIKHPKGPQLLAITAWPQDAIESDPLKEAAAALIKQLSKKMA